MQPCTTFDDLVVVVTCLDHECADMRTSQKTWWVLALQDGDDKEEGNEQLAGALCALAERLLGNTDQLDTVAPECEQLLDRAQHIFPDSPEPLQVCGAFCSWQVQDSMSIFPESTQQ